MAGVKISALPAIVTPALSDIFPVVQAGVTYKETITQLSTLLLPISGGTLTGNLTLFGDPTTNLMAATKQYVDSVAQGLNIQGACRVATTGALTVTYSNGVSGVGATLTNAGAMAALNIDGTALAVNDRVLVKNQASTFQNGIYTVTNIGSGAVNWIMTRATDYDQVAEIQPGDLVLITTGTANANSSWIETATVVTIGTDAISFSQFSASLPVSLANGGTGAALTASNGGIFYSNATTGAILAGTATAGQLLRSGASSAPSWSTSTYPATNSVNTLLYASSANVMAALATANSGVLVTSAGGVPSISSTLPAFTTSAITLTGANPLLDANGNVMQNFTSTAVAVNYFNFTNQIAGQSPSIAANGSDTNIVLLVGGKGTGGASLQGTGTNNSATAGYVGEFVSSQVLLASFVSCTSPTARDITSISLTAGDWQIWGNTGFSVGGTCIGLAGWISSTSATAPDFALYANHASVTTLASDNFNVPTVRMSLAATTTVYLSCRATFSTSTVTAGGGIYARRIR